MSAKGRKMIKSWMVIGRDLIVALGSFLFKPRDIEWKAPEPDLTGSLSLLFPSFGQLFFCLWN